MSDKNKIISKNIRLFFSWRNPSSVITGMETISPLGRWQYVWMNPFSKSPTWNSVGFSDLGGWAFFLYFIYSLLLIVICKKKSQVHIFQSHKIVLLCQEEQTKGKETTLSYRTYFFPFNLNQDLWHASMPNMILYNIISVDEKYTLPTNVKSIWLISKNQQNNS